MRRRHAIPVITLYEDIYEPPAKRRTKWIVTLFVLAVGIAFTLGYFTGRGH